MVRNKVKKGKFKKAVSAVMISAMIGSLGMIFVSANNHGDTDFLFVLDYSQGNPYSYTSLREKQDDSSSYINYENGNLAFAASVSAGYNQRDKVDDNAIERRSKNIQPGNWYYLTNFVKESGYNFAAIRGESSYDVWYRAIGLWSPDSI